MIFKKFSLNSIANNLNNKELSKGLYIFLSVVILTTWLIRVIGFGIEKTITNYQLSCGLTEFLINYEGGFVRRGLFGQCLIWLCRLTSTQPDIWIYSISAISFFAVLAVFLYYFRQQKLCWWLIFSSFLFFFVNSWVRKDFISYFIIVQIVVLLRQNNVSAFNKVFSVVLGTLGIFIHEAFLFYGIPILTLLLLHTDEKYHKNACLLAIPLIAFAINAIFKGNETIVNAIVDSWNQIIPGAPLNNRYPSNSILALNWDVVSTFKFHFRMNFLGFWNNYGVIYSILIQIFNALASYYLLLNFFRFFNRTKVFTIENRNNLSAFYILNGICLLPMFTVLSCDNGRVYQYLWMATIIPFMILSSAKIEMLLGNRVLKIVDKINCCFDRVFRPNRWLTLIIFFSVGIPLASVNIEAGFRNSIFGWIVFIFESVFKIQ